MTTKPAASENVTIDLTLAEAQAYALAQLTKRIGWADARQLAVDDTEARLMLHAAELVRIALGKAGVDVR